MCVCACVCGWVCVQVQVSKETTRLFIIVTVVNRTNINKEVIVSKRLEERAALSAFAVDAHRAQLQQ